MFTKDRSLEELVEEATSKVDVILVEGFKDLRLGYKVELVRGEDTVKVVKSALDYLIKCLEHGAGEDLNTLS